MSASEVARIRQQIDQEIAAFKLAMNGYAGVSRHEIITYHYEALSDRMDELQARIGKQATLQVVAEALERQL